MKNFHQSVCSQIKFEINRGSYISAHVLSNLLSKLRKTDKMQGLPSILHLFVISSINSIIQESIYHMTLKTTFSSSFLA